jgi:hypothetical protein
MKVWDEQELSQLHAAHMTFGRQIAEHEFRKAGTQGRPGARTMLQLWGWPVTAVIAFS